MKFGQIFFFKTHAENEAGRLSSRPLLFCKWSAAYFQSILIVLDLPNNKNKIYKTLEHLPRDMLNFVYFVFNRVCEHLCMIFQEKCFSSYTLLTNQISLPDCCYFLRYYSVYVLQLLVNQVVRLQILKF